MNIATKAQLLFIRTLALLRRAFLRGIKRSLPHTVGVNAYAWHLHQAYHDWLCRRSRLIEAIKKTSVVLFARRPEQEGVFRERALLCLNSMIAAFDEVLLVDWNSPGAGLAAEWRAA